MAAAAAASRASGASRASRASARPRLNSWPPDYLLSAEPWLEGDQCQLCQQTARWNYLRRINAMCSNPSKKPCIRRSSDLYPRLQRASSPLRWKQGLTLTEEEDEEEALSKSGIDSGVSESGCSCENDPERATFINLAKKLNLAHARKSNSALTVVAGPGPSRKLSLLSTNRALTKDGSGLKKQAANTGEDPSCGATAAGTMQRKRRIASIFQHYYPEGHWGYVVLACGFVVQILAHGLQLAFGVLAVAIARRWRIQGEAFVNIGWLGALCTSLSLLISPLTIAFCRRKSTRLTAVLGGLIMALGCLFTSFANQFHQLFLSYGILTALGIGMSRDPATLMIGQYFKRKRELIEMLLVAASGMGIALMSVFIHLSTSRSWRLGLQAVTGVVFFTFFLGTFYRSASLYHPQRRAILHLKSQKRKIKNKDKEKNKAQDDRPPYFDFTTLKSRTVQIMLTSAGLTYVGLINPIFYLASKAFSEGFSSSSVLLFQGSLGMGWLLGCLSCGLLFLRRSVKNRSTGRQYLCQMSLILASGSLTAFTFVEGFLSYLLFSWIYGLSLGGYNYSLKLALYDKVRARNFARAWGFLQCAMGAAILFGVPTTGYVIANFGFSAGHYFCAAWILIGKPENASFIPNGGITIGGLFLSLINVHKRNLRRKQKLRKHRNNVHRSIRSALVEKQLSPQSASPDPPPHEAPSVDSGVQVPLSSSHSHDLPAVPELSSPQSIASSSRGDHQLERKFSFSDQDEYLPPLSLLSHQRSFTYDDFMDTIRLKPELSLFSEEEGIADMELPDHLFLEELEFLDNITSCNQVDNCVMLSEYEQNLIKETETPTPNRRPRRWSLFRQASSSTTDGTPAPVEFNMTLGVGGFRQSSFCGELPSSIRREPPSHAQSTRALPVFQNTARRLAKMPSAANRSITVIEEASL